MGHNNFTISWPINITLLSISDVDKDGKEVGKPHKPFDSTKKPWKKGGGDLGQMAYLTEKIEKLKKKLKKSKSKKSSKKRLRDSSSDSSDSK